MDSNPRLFEIIPIACTVKILRMVQEQMVTRAVAKELLTAEALFHVLGEVHG